MAVAGERLAAAHGVALPDDLRLWSLAGGRPSAAGAAPPGGGPTGGSAGAATTATPAPVPVPVDGTGTVDLAAALEAATSARQRRSRGLHVTPAWLADHLVGLVLDDVGPEPATCDPACGGGAFLVAVARALHARGIPQATVVEDLLWGADIDPVGLAAAEAALAIWSGGLVPPPGRLVLGDPLRRGADLWPDRPPAGFDLVVGNPPFQNQLGKATARAAETRRELRRRFGPAVRAYTDTAWLFLLLGCQVARPGGRVVMVQPQSLAAARDAAAVRAEVEALALLDDLWVDDRRVFAASVQVCAPVLRRHEAAADPPAAAPPAGRWHDLLADATGVPAHGLDGRGRLGDRAAALAGFRDEYYGLAAVVREATAAELARHPAAPALADGPTATAPHRAGRLRAGRQAGLGLGAGGVRRRGPGPAPGAGEAVGRPLITVGAIDWAGTAWGRRPVRFAKQRWEAPTIDAERLARDATPAARAWAARTARPKLLVATQTRVVELAVDEGGEWVPSVPVIAVVPHDPEDLWRLAAALLSPAATVWLSRRTPGVALARGALKVSAGDLAALPLPADDRTWDAAADALRAYVSAMAGDGDGDGDGDAGVTATARAGWPRRSTPTPRRPRPPTGRRPRSWPGGASGSTPSSGPEPQRRRSRPVLAPLSVHSAVSGTFPAATLSVSSRAAGHPPGPATWFGQPRCPTGPGR